MPEHKQEFLSLLSSSLREKTFTKMTLGKFRGAEPELENIYVKPVMVKGEERLSLVWRYKTRDVTKNLSHSAALALIEQELGAAFKSGHLFTSTGEASIEFSKKGKTLLRQKGMPMQEGKEEASVLQGHDREKKRRLDPTSPFLRRLGVTDQEGRVIPSMSRKWKQMDKFLEIFGNALESSGPAEAPNIHVVDFGSGKGYLTFAVYDFLRNRIGDGAQVTGVELRQDLVDLCNAAAAGSGMEGLHFYQGDIRNYAPERIDVMIALHACDIATDLALYKGIAAGARVIMSAPCCHKEIRPQMQTPEALRPMLRHGVHLGQEAEMVTDTMRSLLLEANGYKTGVFEFVSLEHTSKNKMILAVKAPVSERRERILKQIAAIKEFYGIEHQTLETLLSDKS